MIPVAEIFGPTIQGEGPDVGKRVIFIRVCGCDFNCSWCDSKFAWVANAKTIRYTPGELAEEIIARCIDKNCYNVIITGGNPCLYDLSFVIKSLHDKEIKVGIETQGSKLPYWLNDVDTLVFSPKAPSSGQINTYDNILGYIKESNKDQLIAVKIPVFNDEDIDFARSYSEMVNRMIILGYDRIRFYLSVGNGDVAEKGAIRDRILSRYEDLINSVNENPDGFENVYILPQVHTLVWGNRQGV